MAESINDGAAIAAAAAIVGAFFGPDLLLLY
jgi:hypothetical protein